MAWRDANKFYGDIRALSDEDWAAVLRHPELSDIGAPTFPAAEFQIGIHGHAGEHSINEATKFYREAASYANFCQTPLRSDRALLDFGCGWGRILRPFMRDIKPSNIFGAEPGGERVVVARSHNPYVNFIQSNYLPPIPLADNSIDYVTAWSVFSHLDEFSTRKWFAEFQRILRPGGLIFITTQGLQFLDQCEKHRKTKEAGGQLEHPWHEALARSFVDTDGCRNAYKRAEYLFSGTAGKIPHEGARYGEAIISAQFVKNNLCDGFDFIDHVDDPNRFATGADRSAEAALIVPLLEVGSLSVRIDLGNNLADKKAIVAEQHDFINRIDLLGAQTDRRSIKSLFRENIARSALFSG